MSDHARLEASTSRRRLAVLLAVGLSIVLGACALPAVADDAMRIDSVEPEIAGPGDLLTLTGARLPGAADGVVVLRDRLGAGTLCAIESSTGDLLVCRVDDAAEPFSAPVEVFRGRWIDRAPRVEPGGLGAWIVAERLFVAEDGTDGAASGPAVEVPAADAGGASVAWNARHRPTWLELDIGVVATGIPGTIGVDFVHQPGKGGGDGGGIWPGRGTVIHQIRLDLVGESPIVDPWAVTSDLALLLAASVEPFGASVEASEAILTVAPDPWTDGAFLVLRAPAGGGP